MLLLISQEKYEPLWEALVKENNDNHDAQL